jgi:hypothetical protein
MVHDPQTDIALEHLVAAADEPFLVDPEEHDPVHDRGSRRLGPIW